MYSAFGSAVGGALADPSDNSGGGNGAAYVFLRDGNTWLQEAFLKASNTDRGDGLGEDVALSEDGSLLIVSAGPQLDALEGLSVPPNALCRSYVAQVDILQSGLVDMFVTHGARQQR